MAKTCIRVEACNIGSSERHNLRSKELDYRLTAFCQMLHGSNVDGIRFCMVRFAIIGDGEGGGIDCNIRLYFLCLLYPSITEGFIVKRTKRIASIMVGEGMLGRVIDPLGAPLDGKGLIGTV